MTQTQTQSPALNPDIPPLPAPLKRRCTGCGHPLPEYETHDLCPVCRIKRRAQRQGKGKGW